MSNIIGIDGGKIEDEKKKGPPDCEWLIKDDMGNETTAQGYLNLFAGLYPCVMTGEEGSVNVEFIIHPDHLVSIKLVKVIA